MTNEFYIMMADYTEPNVYFFYGPWDDLELAAANRIKAINTSGVFSAKLTCFAPKDAEVRTAARCHNEDGRAWPVASFAEDLNLIAAGF